MVSNRKTIDFFTIFTQKSNWSIIFSIDFAHKSLKNPLHAKQSRWIEKKIINFQSQPFKMMQSWSEFNKSLSFFSFSIQIKTFFALKALSSDAFFEGKQYRRTNAEERKRIWKNCPKRFFVCMRKCSPIICNRMISNEMYCKMCVCVCSIEDANKCEDSETRRKTHTQFLLSKRCQENGWVGKSWEIYTFHLDLKAKQRAKSFVFFWRWKQRSFRSDRQRCECERMQGRKRWTENR